jgi:predicted ATPase
MRQPSYLGPFRAEPGSVTRAPSQGVQTLGPRGERSIELLADDKLRHGGSVGKKVSTWFTETLGQGIAVDINGIRPQLMVTEDASAMDLSLADTGAGFAQVLPICVQNYAYQAGRLPGSLLIVEQPELHLHPAAHGNVADLVVASSKADQGWEPATCLIETHSEQFIMRIRRRIAEGLGVAQAVLWSLKHKESFDEEDSEALRVIKFNDQGDPETWPVGVFEEAFADLAQARHAARDRGL